MPCNAAPFPYICFCNLMTYNTKKEAMAQLKKNPLKAVSFKEGGKIFNAVYFNGKIHILKEGEKKYWN